MGLDKPIYTQFFLWASKVLRGDLGHSIFLNQPVSVAILEHLECTVSLALLALTYALLVSVPIGVIAAVKQNAWQDKLVMAFALFGVSAPSFWTETVFSLPGIGQLVISAIKNRDYPMVQGVRSTISSKPPAPWGQAPRGFSSGTSCAIPGRPSSCR
jgi:ABC-type dipeptide/oligopeptide/nickel transport system permease component